jgi:ankyrin repeat protein
MKQYLLMLLSLGSLIYANGEDSPLHRAAARCREDVIRALLKQGMPIDIRNADNETPLMYAALRCPSKTIDIFFRYGAAINARDRRQRTALWYAAKGCNIAGMQQLVKRGADLSVMHEVGKFGRTPYQDVQEQCSQVARYYYGMRFPPVTDFSFLKEKEKK